MHFPDEAQVRIGIGSAVIMREANDLPHAATSQRQIPHATAGRRVSELFDAGRVSQRRQRAGAVQGAVARGGGARLPVRFWSAAALYRFRAACPTTRTSANSSETHGRRAIIPHLSQKIAMNRLSVRAGRLVDSVPNPTVMMNPASLPNVRYLWPCALSFILTSKEGGYEELCMQIVRFFKTGQPPVRPEETIEVFAFMEAADQSKRQGGAPVSLAAVLAKGREEAKAKVPE